MSTTDYQAILLKKVLCFVREAEGGFVVSEDRKTIWLWSEEDFEEIDYELGDAATCGVQIPIKGEGEGQLDYGIRRLPDGGSEDDDNLITLSRWDASREVDVELATIRLVVDKHEATRAVFKAHKP